MPPAEDAARARRPARVSDLTAVPLPPLPLAQGDLTEQDAAELAALKQLIQQRVGFVCDGYKERCLRRRIAVRMRARGTHAYGEYAQLLERDPEEYARLADTLTINVSKFFRNPEVWTVLREQVVPELFAAPGPIRVWSAGSAGGEEPYSAAMLLHDWADAHGESCDRFTVLGTDIDRDSLAFAERGEYGDFAMTDTDPELRARWFDGSGPYAVKPRARERVRFGVLDLMRDPFPAEQSLIFCRNVIIYFERSVQEELFRRFHAALVPGGYLVLGKVEALFGPATSLFRTVANRQRVFRRA